MVILAFVAVPALGVADSTRANATTPQDVNETSTQVPEVLRGLLESGESLGLQPDGDPKELRGRTRLYFFVGRYDLNVASAQGTRSGERGRWSSLDADREQILHRIGSGLPGVSIVDRVADADVVVTVCEIHLQRGGTADTPTTSCRIYRTAPGERSGLRMLLKVGPYQGTLKANVDAVSDRFITVYSSANQIVATLPN